MLTRLVRIQLALFTVASLCGIAAMVINYLQVPTWFGIGRVTVTVELPGTGGLYRFSNVTYRGVQVGQVTSVRPTRDGARAVLSLHATPHIPADVRAEVHSMSAVGEQYVNLIPRGDGPPFLRDGAIIARANTTVPQQIGPVLDQLSALLKTIPQDQLSTLLDESFNAFNGAGDDLSSLLDSASRVADSANAASGHTKTLIDDTGPFLDAQAQTTDQVRAWARSLAGVTDQMVHDDRPFRAVLHTGPGFTEEVSRLLVQVKPTLPVLLANLTTVGQIGVTYHPSLEQLLLLLPPYVAATGSYGAGNNATGHAVGGFALSIADPPACTVGFLPPSAWRSPAETDVVDTPDDLYCKLPQDSPIAVRGARNYPCMGHPGKRAPTVEICNSDRPYVPLAMREHALGPYPFDPNLIAQGVPPDDRVTFNDNIYGPTEGTPPPPGPGPAEAPPAPAPPEPAPADPGPPDPAAPSAFTGGPAGPSVAVTKYDPRTGRYVAPDGLVYQQSSLVPTASAKTWTDLLPH
ncbi:MCE family protein [Mycobacterium sp. pUA109]|uniref:MCE family protein n=1 Tax=Mycobacterium sp. pUA109 TaxID=3238982 RepID=UPI00351BDCB7